MLLVVHADFWLNYFILEGKTTLSENEDLVRSIVRNPNNRFIYSRRLFDLTEEYLKEIDDPKFDYLDLFQQTFIDLNHHDRTETCNNQSNGEIAQELLEIYKSIGFVQFMVSKYTEIKLEGKNNYAVYELIEKPNKHWLLHCLMATNGRHGFRIDWSDFSDNSEVISFFEDLFEINRGGERIHIQTNYAKFGQLFQSISGRKITFYTTGKDPKTNDTKSQEEIDRERFQAKALLGDKMSFKTSNDNTILHQRSILHGNILVSCDHQFNSIVVENRNWQVNVIYCANERRRKEEILLLFS